MNESKENYRRTHLSQLLDLPMPDAVYSLFDYNRRNSGSSMEIDIQELDSLGLLEHLQEWEQRGHKLRSDACAGWCKIQLEPNPNISELASKLALENPGFGESSYRKAIDYAMMVLR